MINTKLLIRAFKLICFIGLILLLCNSCKSNPTANEPETELSRTMLENHSIMPGELPQPMIVGGYPVDPACPNCKYDFMVSLQYNGGMFNHTYDDVNPTGRKDYEIYFANGGDRGKGNTPEMDTCRKLDVTMLWGIGGGKIQSSSWLINGGKDE